MVHRNPFVFELGVFLKKERSVNRHLSTVFFLFLGKPLRLGFDTQSAGDKRKDLEEIGALSVFVILLDQVLSIQWFFIAI